MSIENWELSIGQISYRSWTPNFGPFNCFLTIGSAIKASISALCHVLRGALTQVFNNSLVQGQTIAGKHAIKLFSEHINTQEPD